MKPEKLARCLNDAYPGPLAPPLADALVPLDRSVVCDVQALDTAHWVDQHRKVADRKLGLTGKAVQAQFAMLSKNSYIRSRTGRSVSVPNSPIPPSCPSCATRNKSAAFMAMTPAPSSSSGHRRWSAARKATIADIALDMVNTAGDKAR